MAKVCPGRRPWRKAVISPSRCRGQRRAGEAGLREQLGTWRPPQRPGGEKGSIASRPHTCPPPSGPQSAASRPTPTGSQARAATAAPQLRADPSGGGPTCHPPSQWHQTGPHCRPWRQPGPILLASCASGRCGHRGHHRPRPGHKLTASEEVKPSSGDGCAEQAG